MRRSVELEKAYADLIRQYGCTIERDAPQPWGNHAPEHPNDSKGLSESGSDPRPRVPLPSMQRMLDVATDEVEAAIERASISVGRPVLVRTFPTGAFNAEARMTDHGVLILINSGLASFLAAAVALSSYAWRFANPQTGVENAKSRLATPVTIGEIVEQMASLVASYVAPDRHWKSGFGLPDLPDGPRLEMTAMKMQACLKFAIAHEYAHVIGGHIDDAVSLVVKTPVGKLELLAKSRLQEFQADVLATRLLMKDMDVQTSRAQVGKRLDRIKIGGGEVEVDLDAAFGMRMAASGPIMFFTLDELINKVALAVRRKPPVQILTDHPPSNIRMDVISNEIASQYGPGIMDMGIAERSWFADRGDEIARLVASHL